MAQTWTDLCQYEHGQPTWTDPPYGGTLGQNLYMSTGAGTADAAIDAWYNEIAYYDFDTRACSDVCGHYTQVVMMMMMMMMIMMSMVINLITLYYSPPRGKRFITNYWI
jgi:hypothetical protein